MTEEIKKGKRLFFQNPNHGSYMHRRKREKLFHFLMEQKRILSFGPHWLLFSKGSKMRRVKAIIDQIA